MYFGILGESLVWIFDTSFWLNQKTTFKTFLKGKIGNLLDFVLWPLWVILIDVVE